LPAAMIPALVAVLREHRPALRLPRQSQQVLRELRPSWRIGVLTNGAPDIQRRKVAALGLTSLVDEVVCATEIGDGFGKPARTTFETALQRLGAVAPAAVFVGDDPDADIAGAIGAGLHAIHLVDDTRAGDRCGDSCRGVHVGRLGQVPALANQLVPARTDSHAL
jgi:putative hydrolase of the HAD superfamily